MSTRSALEEKQIRIESAKLGAEIALSRLGLIKDGISQREAYRLAGESQIRSWINEGLLIRIPGKGRNSKCSYSRIEIETLLHLKEKQVI